MAWYFYNNNPAIDLNLQRLDVTQNNFTMYFGHQEIISVSNALPANNFSNIYGNANFNLSAYNFIQINNLFIQQEYLILTEQGYVRQSYTPYIQGLNISGSFGFSNAAIPVPVSFFDNLNTVYYANSYSYYNKFNIFLNYDYYISSGNIFNYIGFTANDYAFLDLTALYNYLLAQSGSSTTLLNLLISLKFVLTGKIY